VYLLYLELNIVVKFALLNSCVNSMCAESDGIW